MDTALNYGDKKETCFDFLMFPGAKIYSRFIIDQYLKLQRKAWIISESDFIIILPLIFSLS